MMQRIDMLMMQIVQALNNVGIEATNIARETHLYTDRTGNLTSSIGYIIILDGQVQGVSGFEQVKDGDQGSSIGMEYVVQQEKSHAEGLSLIVVAGMPYAAYVERMNLNVLKGAEEYAVGEAKKKINDVLNIWRQ